MIILFHKDFEKRYTKLRVNEKEKFKERRDIFLQNPFHQALNNHVLKGKYSGFRSINITGDLRVLYKLLDKDTVIFATIDTHSNLYK